ncbi:MAG: hypothetical protein SGJ24_01340 [Chloroflexota bacterium]|nr:hypothetical protein [Chloroflexota bacterium]
MAFLNQAEREKLLNDLRTMKFNRAKGKLRRLDPKGKLAYFRNAQESGKLSTRFELHGMGTVVTLIESNKDTVTATDAAGANATRWKSELTLLEVVVEPMPENRT